MNSIADVVNYYNSAESRLGYRLITFGAKHFGYYPNGLAIIGEAAAQNNLHELLISKLNIRSGDTVLDAGCGEGVVGVAVARKTGAFVEGVTIVPFEAEQAAKRAARGKVGDRTRFRVLDYSNLDFPDAYFDAVYTVETLVHSCDLVSTLAGFYRVLKPSGRLVNFEYSLATDNDLMKDKYLHESEVFDWVIEKSAMHSLKVMRHGKFLELLQEAGFSDVTEENITPQMLPSFDRLYRLAKWPYTVIHRLGLEEKFVNATTAAVLFPLIKNTDLFRYNLYTSEKPAG